MSSEFNTLKLALDKIAAGDNAIATYIQKIGYPEDRFMDEGFQTLARTIIGQQISRAVASHIWEKLQDEGWIDEGIIAERTIDELKGCGLSGRKAEYLIGLAQACVSGALHLPSLRTLSGEDVQQALIAIRGIGAWTADNYRLFALGDMDAWPGNDLALQEAMKRLRGLDTRPTSAEMDKLAASWAPYRGAVALMLWHIYAFEVRNASPASI